MRLTTIHIEATPPIQHFDVTGLSDIVFIGGPNGVGKTRLLSSLIRFFRKPNPSPSFYLTFDATNDEEEADWGKQRLDTRNTDDCTTLTRTLQKTDTAPTGKPASYILRVIAPFNESIRFLLVGASMIRTPNP